jgi:hypothetical protein
METWTWRHEHGDMDNGHMELKYRGILSFTKKNQMEKEAPAIFLNLFTVCSLCKWKFVVYTFVEEKTKGSNPSAKG